MRITIFIINQLHMILTCFVIMNCSVLRPETEPEYPAGYRIYWKSGSGWAGTGVVFLKIPDSVDRNRNDNQNSGSYRNSTGFSSKMWHSKSPIQSMHVFNKSPICENGGHLPSFLITRFIYVYTSTSNRLVAHTLLHTGIMSGPLAPQAPAT